MPAVPTSSQGGGNTNPAIDGFDIVPNDDEELEAVTRMITAEGAGDIHLLMASGREMTVPFGALQERPLCVRKVFATGTTATGIQGFY